MFRLRVIFKSPAPTETYTLSLHDALPICLRTWSGRERSSHKHRPHVRGRTSPALPGPRDDDRGPRPRRGGSDRKSTRLNSSHTVISYAVFCLKKKKMYEN